MKKSEIKVGGIYVAKVGANITTVRVDAIREVEGRTSGQSYWSKTTPSQTHYEVTNLATGRTTTFRSAMKFRSAIRPCPTCNLDVVYGCKCSKEENERQLAACITKTIVVSEEITEGEQGSDPTKSPSLSDGTTPLPQNGISPTSPSQNSTPSATSTSSGSAPSDVSTAQASATPSPVSTTPNPTAPAVAKSAVVMAIDANGNRISSRLASRIATSTAALPPHVIVEARAGTGKTTTIMTGIAKTFEKRSPGLWAELTRRVGFEMVPSEQQQAVWDQMALSADARTVQMVAFNKSIVREFEDKWGWLIAALKGCNVTLQFATNHSMGFSAIRRAFGKRLEVSEYRVKDIIADILKVDIRDLRKDKFELLKATEQLVGLCKMNLVGGDREQLDALTSHYDVEMNGHRNAVYDLVPQVIERCKDPHRDGRIDFDDMVWLPCTLDLSVFQNDLLLVDECQDLNRCQQALAKKAGKRIIMVGDPRQAIYGFAGADAESMPRMTCELGATERKCVTLPLTVTRRCGQAIVKEANTIVADFYAHESNSAGIVSEAKYPTETKDGRTVERKWEDCYMSQVKDGDFILCRVNAPLVSNCFRFLKRGIKANIQGRDVGQGLVSTITKLKPQSVSDLVGKVSDWLNAECAKESAKRNPSEARIIALQDRADCILAFTDGCAKVDDVVAKINSVFTDDRQNRGVRLSSVHKAKGLEAKRVFILMPKGASMPHSLAKSEWQYEQELNLKYVAITRAIDELVWVY